MTDRKLEPPPVRGPSCLSRADHAGRARRASDATLLTGTLRRPGQRSGDSAAGDLATQRSGTNASPRLRRGDFRLGPRTARDREEARGMSYVVGTRMAAFCHGEDHPRSVPVAAGGMPARFAPEGSFTQPGALLVSREARRAGHRGVGGRNQHHRPARPPAASGQFPLGRTDRGVGGLACHRGPGQEQRPEVRHGDHLVVVDDPPGPDAGRVGVLPGGLLVQRRRRAPDPAVSAGTSECRPFLPMAEARGLPGRSL